MGVEVRSARAGVRSAMCEVVVSSQRVRAGVGDETVPSSRESGMTGFLPGAPARAA